ncbi:MAG: DNA repair protein RecN [Candidatus Thermofonsia Clade 1 bacterium]|uniref:DNA repair protein RecN n=1 Tax=Candidatus Thermofonsia Clade 1 bacterium TaxID=2364210 RepID=A0A2M8P1F7_9CHLR|nr:MAG: DNA repair protein RecN [Candidatus Thermofonsia Clade 1 bacterium]
MLSELRIADFAIIDQLEVQFAGGFNVITGETGAGKSIIIDAVDLVLGGRADSDFIRAGREKATVEAVFRLSADLRAALLPLLNAEQIELTGDELTLTRELRANGRNTCRVNGTMVSLQFYREIGQRLVDIHGQGEHLSLLRTPEHLYLLDRYASLEVSRAQLADLVAQLSALRAEIAQLQQDEAALARRMDMLSYQLEEIRAVAPRPEEEAALRAESERLANAEQIAALSSEALRLSDSEDETPSALSLLNQIAALLHKLSRFDPRMAEHAASADNAVAQVEDIARALSHYVETIEHNPNRLYEVEERLDALNRLKRKYGGSIEAVLDYAARCELELQNITNSEARLAQLRTEEESLLRKIGERAGQISAARRQAAEKLSAAVVRELAELRMEGARFEVAITQADDPEGCYMGERRLKFDATGIDTVEFMLAANRGEPLRPLAKVASGGETARIMLALKTVLSRADHTPTLIFDEIDQGIGGRVGRVVGQKLWRLSDGHQVLCVTHLAHIAGFADKHFRVSKGYSGERTVAMITELNDRARVDEIAEMLGAETVSARQSAHDILVLARNIKEGKSVQESLL